MEFDSPVQITRLVIRNDVGKLTNANVYLIDKYEEEVAVYQIGTDVQPVIACSSSGGDCNGIEPKSVQFDDIYDVKCCADSPSSSDISWVQNNPQCPFKLMFEGSNSIDACPETKTYAEAVAFCESYPGGRLCTQDELDRDCAEGVGLCNGIDDELIWSSTKIPPTLLPTLEDLL